MSELSSFKEQLHAAAAKGHLHKVTDSYVKIRWWSMRGYFRTLSNWRIRLIGLRVKRRIETAARRAEDSRNARRAVSIKRADVLRDATASISLSGS